MKEEKINEVKEETCCGEHGDVCCSELQDEILEGSGCCGGGCHNEQEEIDPEVVLQQEIETLKDQLLRNKADFENFKKRLNDERIRDNKYRSQNLATAILPALDTFERAMRVETENDEVKNFLIGFEMIHKQILESLASEGIEVIQAEGQPFDPNFHQAVMQESIDGTDSGIVIAEMQKGYKLKDRVIRPAMVKVSE